MLWPRKHELNETLSQDKSGLRFCKVSSDANRFDFRTNLSCTSSKHDMVLQTEILGMEFEQFSPVMTAIPIRATSAGPNFGFHLMLESNKSHLLACVAHMRRLCCL